jgi:lipopolysaccharide biosynthesis regulator YciM
MSDPGGACDEIIFYAKTHPGSAMAETSAAAAILQRSRDKQDLTLVRSLLEGALAVNPLSVEANYLMGVWNQQQSLWQASIPFLQKALQIDSGYGKAHYRMARAFFRLGSRADGEREIELTAQCNREEQNQANQEMKDLQPFLVQMH